MSDLTPSEPEPVSDPASEIAAAPEPAAPGVRGEQELSVDLAAFLPDGVELGDETVLGDEDGQDGGDVVVVDDELVVVETSDGVVVVEEVVVAAEDEIVVIDEVVAVVAEPPAPPVDLEALSQIERDLDAVDAAIAALDAGTYGIDPVTGQPIDDALLAEDPTRLG